MCGKRKLCASRAVYCFLACEIVEDFERETNWKSFPPFSLTIVEMITSYLSAKIDDFSGKNQLFNDLRVIH